MTYIRSAKSVVFAAFIAAALYLSGFLVILTPLPLVYASASRGRWAGIGASLLSLIAISALYLLLFKAGAGTANTGIAAYLPIPGEGLIGFMPLEFLRTLGIGYFIFFAVVAIALSEGARHHLDLLKWGSLALFAGVTVIFVIAVIAAKGAAGSLVDGAALYIRFVVDEVIKVNATSNNTTTQIQLLTDHADEVVAFVMKILPSLLLVYALVAVVLNMIIGRRLIRSHHLFSHVHNVARFRLPEAIVWGLIAAGLAFFADSYMFHKGYVAAVGFNAAIVFGALYFFQGLAVAVYFLQGIKFPFLRTVVYVAMIIFVQATFITFVILGVADIWVDFRARRWRAMHQNSHES